MVNFETLKTKLGKTEYGFCNLGINEKPVGAYKYVK